jgi:hypothetical protein
MKHVTAAAMYEHRQSLLIRVDPPPEFITDMTSNNNHNSESESSVPVTGGHAGESADDS